MLTPLLLLLPLLGAVVDGEPPADVAPAAAKKTRVLVLDVAGDLEENQKSTLTNLIVARLSRFEPLEVIAQKNVEKLIGIEATKQVAGCEGESGCLAELAGAFNAEIVAAPQAGKIGGTTVFTLQLLDPKGTTVGRGTAQVSGLDDLVTRITEVVDGVGKDFTHSEPADSFANPQPTTTAAPKTAENAAPDLRQPLLIGGGVGVGVGVALVAIGVIPALQASGAEGDLKVLRVRYVDAGRDDDLLQQAKAKQKDAEDARGLWNGAGIYAVWSGVVVVAAGGGALAASFLLQDAP